MSARILRPLVLVALAVLGLSACGSADDGSDDEQQQRLTVFAAASLTDSFTDLAEQFEEDHPGVDVQLSLAGSSSLVTQLQEGADADVLATADERTMEQAAESGLLEGDPQTLATNTLTIAVPAGNPGGVDSWEDLASSELDTVICEQRVPCGAATVELEDITGVRVAVVSEESSVTDVLGKVTSGQADVGVVYRTDVTSAGDQVEEIEIPDAVQAINRYPISVLADSQHQELAQEFSDFVRSDTGRQRLEQEGFGAP